MKDIVDAITMVDGAMFIIKSGNAKGGVSIVEGAALAKAVPKIVIAINIMNKPQISAGFLVGGLPPFLPITAPFIKYFTLSSSKIKNTDNSPDDIPVIIQRIIRTLSDIPIIVHFHFLKICFRSLLEAAQRFALLAGG